VASAASGEEEEDAASSPEEGNNDDEQPEEGTAGDSPSFDDIEDDEDEDENPPVDPAFRQRVAEALGVSGVAVDDETESDASDGDSEVWDDEQILKVDEQLAEAFRQQANTSKRSGLKREQFPSDNQTTAEAHL
jgi:DNA polymerase phi